MEVPPMSIAFIFPVPHVRAALKSESTATLARLQIPSENAQLARDEALKIHKRKRAQLGALTIKLSRLDSEAADKLLEQRGKPTGSAGNLLSSEGRAPITMVPTEEQDKYELIEVVEEVIRVQQEIRRYVMEVKRLENQNGNKSGIACCAL